MRALSRWPKDNLRPECQFQDAMRRRIERRFLPASSPNTPTAAQAVANSAVDEKVELEQVNAIYSLLENRYSRKVCSLLRF
jgi:cytochrome b pre-mRNA-processing protein 6